ncbi:MAG: 4-alpha-glucanotransferase [Saprospiraceae bacterium]
MTITFRINYHTVWGQQIAVMGSIPELGGWEITKAVRLQHLGDGEWELPFTLQKNPVQFSYKYVLVNDNNEELDRDWGANRTVVLAKKEKNILLKDTWRSKHHEENAFYTSAFEKAIFKPDLFKVKNKAVAGKKLVQFQLHDPRVVAGQQICLLGNIPELGDWDLRKPILLGNENYPLWSTAISLNSEKDIEYKYGIYSVKEKKVQWLEKGGNRIFPKHFFAAQNDRIVVTDEYFNHPNGHWKGAGVATPVFSLRSQESFGVGEFSDIKKLVDWSKMVGLKMVQILPINDTIATKTWVDSYPYAAISVFALHPLFLRVEELDGFDEIIDQKKYKNEKKELNDLAVVDYEKSLSLKLEYAKLIFNKIKDEFLEKPEFKAFFSENEHWLKPYALFSFYRDKYKTPDFNQWGKDGKYSLEKLKKETSQTAKNFTEIAFYYFLQFHLDRQLKSAAEYARKNGLVLKGDIPIGIYRYSVDAWTEPHLYNMDGQSGAPPDPFSDIGQNWGFPTYNWEEMAKDGFQWWQNRLRQLSRYFDAFRIDHILGFFRIWQIPLDQVEGTFGFFNAAIPIHLNEFKEKGISFNYDRYCKPYITVEILNGKFGEEALYVVEHFLTKNNTGTYFFKEEFNTQRKVENYFNKKENAGKAHLKDRLFKLLSNVLFFEVPGSGGKEFHPRIDFPKLSSFEALNGDQQHRLNELYLDYFYHRQDEFWKEQALKKLPAIKDATNMLICGEDLGMVPGCVPGVMKDLGILTLEIQRMSKNPKTEFLQEADIPYLSVCSPSTHDMSPIRLWWEEMEVDQRQRFYWHEIHQIGQPPVFCEPYVVERILAQQLKWDSLWTVFAIQDIFALDGKLRRENPAEERINIPAITQHYWQYRMHISLEELMHAEALNNQFYKLIAESGKG